MLMETALVRSSKALANAFMMCFLCRFFLSFVNSNKMVQTKLVKENRKVLTPISSVCNATFTKNVIEPQNRIWNHFGRKAIPHQKQAPAHFKCNCNLERWQPPLFYKPL